MKKFVNKKIVCPICKNKNFSYKFSGKDCFYHTNNDKNYDIIECDSCKLEMVYPMPSIKEQQTFYPSNYYSYINNVCIKKGKFTNFISNIGLKATTFMDDKKLKLPNFVGNNKNFLDIGCGAGQNLVKMENIGRNAKGFEISHKLFNKNNIYYGPSIVNINFLEKYDYIRCHHVFEHVYNPIDFLQKCHSILKDNGIIIICLPNVKSISSKIYGRYASDRDIPRHLFGYNYKNIQTLFKSNGFDIIYSNYNQNYGSLQSFSWFIYDKYKKNISNIFLLKIIFLLFDIILSLFKRTNSMGFILKKIRGTND